MAVGGGADIYAGTARNKIGGGLKKKKSLDGDATMQPTSGTSGLLATASASAPAMFLAICDLLFGVCVV